MASHLQLSWSLSSGWCRSVTPEERLHEALDMGDATSVVIHLKHFARTLHSVAMMAPAQVHIYSPIKCTHCKARVCILFVLSAHAPKSKYSTAPAG